MVSNFDLSSLFWLFFASSIAAFAFWIASLVFLTNSAFIFFSCSSLWTDVCFSALASAIACVSWLISAWIFVFSSKLFASLKIPFAWLIAFSNSFNAGSSVAIVLAFLVASTFAFNALISSLIFVFHSSTILDFASRFSLVCSKTFLALSNLVSSSEVSSTNFASLVFVNKVSPSAISFANFEIAASNSSIVLALIHSPIATSKSSKSFLTSFFNLSTSCSFCAIFCSILVFASSNFLIASFTLLASSFNPSCSASFL